MAAATRHRSTAAADLPSDFTRALLDDADLSALLRHYRAEPTRKNQDRLAVAYLPLAFIVACVMLRRCREAAERPLDELASDCSLGLMLAIRDCPHDDPARFRCYAVRAMKNRVWDSLREWSWGASERADRKRWQVRRFRGAFVRENGRAPEPVEVEAHLRSVVTNPAIQVGNDPRLFTLSHLSRPEASDATRAMRDVPDAARPAAAALMDAEAMRLALSGFAPGERRVLNMILDGATRAEVAAEYGIPVSTAKARVNGLLWRARCHVELAGYLGVSPRLRPEARKRPRATATPRPPRPPQAARACDYCGGTFTPAAHAHAQRFCSDPCRVAEFRQRRREAV
jgi:RNA polymerase sigma factor (sigma-70 family)